VTVTHQEALKEVVLTSTPQLEDEYLPQRNDVIFAATYEYFDETRTETPTGKVSALPQSSGAPVRGPRLM